MYDRVSVIDCSVNPTQCVSLKSIPGKLVLQHSTHSGLSLSLRVFLHSKNSADFFFFLIYVYNYATRGVMTDLIDEDEDEEQKKMFDRL